MKTHKLCDNILLFTFNNHKEITLTFCRVQEYYESPNPNLVGKQFSFYEFINESMNSKGVIDYFEYWSGFNFPGNIAKEWLELNSSNLTGHEIALFDEISKNVDMQKPFYIIGSLEKEKDTIKHEIAHALYFLDENYRWYADIFNIHFKQDYPRQYNKMVKELIKMGYNANVIPDEIQAYLASEPKKYLIEDFKLNYDTVSKYNKKDKLSSLIREYKYLLQKYNTFMDKIKIS